MDLSSIWSMILSLVSESGVWAMLFLALLIVLIKSNNARESKYQTIIEKLGNSLKKVEEIKEDVEDLKFAAGIGGTQKTADKNNIKNTQINNTTNQIIEPTQKEKEATNDTKGQS